VAGTALLASACSSTPSAVSATSQPSSSATVITTMSTPDGTILSVGGHAVYLWEKDTTAASQCSGACAAAWPPVTVTGVPEAAGAAKASDLGTFTRADGTEQVTYNGHPLYYFAGDTGHSENGQGSDGFGALWWLVSPSGTAVTGHWEPVPSSVSPSPAPWSAG
jgi:predicted lipoprotein with Yx(FWY)xxD motif